MTTAIRRATFNGNQFNSRAKWRADLLARMPLVDRIMLQEAVHFDLAAFVVDPKVIAQVGAWGAVQTRDGNNDGRANTAILFRVSAGVPSQHVLVDLGRATGPAKDQHTRERLLCAALFPEGWDGSFHGFPARDAAFNAHLVETVGKWVHSVTEPVTLGADINKIPPAQIEKATGLTWHGVDIDGFFGKVSHVAAFPKGNSDHPGVHATSIVVPVEPTHIETAQAELHKALKSAVRHNRQERAGQIRKALHALRVALTKPVVWTFPAIIAARSQSANGPAFPEGTCLQQDRTCYKIGPLAADAIGAWQAAKVKHPETDPTKIPRGYPVFWSGGSHGHGHIAISAGDGRCWSSDIVRIGFFDNVPITEIHAKWGLTMVGWTEDLNGVRIVAKVAK